MKSTMNYLVACWNGLPLTALYDKVTNKGSGIDSAGLPHAETVGGYQHKVMGKVCFSALAEKSMAVGDVVFSQGEVPVVLSG